MEERLDIVKKYSEILDLNEKIVETGGKINFETRKTIKDFGMMDALIYSTAQIYGLKLLTGDDHFKSLDDVVML
jgi:predicted nucleic acid-binding protein